MDKNTRHLLDLTILKTHQDILDIFNKNLDDPKSKIKYILNSMLDDINSKDSEYLWFCFAQLKYFIEKLENKNC